ncbi:MAG: oligopeptide transporter, OPT family [Isosphaeraceae bacterium]|nr:oligopeptide transporter, OPT family [Isosphaeraceae bacterium]
MSVSPPPVAEVPGEEPGPVDPGFRPYVPDNADLPELTGSAVLLGAILGIIFGASSLYLFLKVGMTVSASIPVAVLAITIFRAFSQAFGTRRATILENNIVQTTGSAGESIAFGVGATMPALMILGYDMDPLRVMLVSVLGGLLGILMMIPLRRAFIVKQHGELKYPEGAACAKILVVGEQGGSSAKTVFTGFGLAFLYQALMEAMKLWSKEPAKLITGIKGYSKAVLMCEVSPALLGVGYIIGTRTASVMVGGGLLTSLVLVPMIAYFGAGLSDPLPPGTALIRDMGPGDIAKSYVRYIGAGAVATGGIISMCRALPMIVSSLTGSLRAFRSGGATGGVGRTERDLPLWVVALGCLGLVAAISSSHLIPTTWPGRVAGAGMILVFGFLFVTVSSRITGEIGSSSNPISGMTIATLLLTCLIFYLLGWVGEQYRVAALSIAAIVCIASSNGGTISQDLKTGFLVGATPRAQQLSIVVGAVTSAVVIGFTLLFLNWVYTDVVSDAQYLPKVQAQNVETLTQTEAGPDGKTYKVWWVNKTMNGAEPGRYLVDDQGKAHFRVDPGIGGIVKTRADGSKASKFTPPQPALFAVIIDGIMTGQLAWALVILGAALAIVMYLAGVSPLAFAVGVYLPLATTMPIFVGGLVRGLVDRFHKMSDEESDSSPAVLLSSGLIAGGSIAGILLAFLAVFPAVGRALDVSGSLPKGWNEQPGPALVAFGVLIAVLAFVGLRGTPPVRGADLSKRGEISNGVGE